VRGGEAGRRARPSPRVAVTPLIHCQGVLGGCRAPRSAIGVTGVGQCPTSRRDMPAGERAYLVALLVSAVARLPGGAVCADPPEQRRAGRRSCSPSWTSSGSETCGIEAVLHPPAPQGGGRAEPVGRGGGRGDGGGCRGSRPLHRR
jgi:hypothetical protein